MSDVPLEFLLAERRRRNPQKTFKSLEDLLVDPALFGLTTATPVQRAICRIADGVPLGELVNNEAVVEALGCEISALPEVRPKQLAILSGIRVGKSLLAALLAVYWTQTCDVSQLGPGEIARVSIVSISTDLAEVVFGHVSGRIAASEQLKKLIVGKPMKDSIMLRHPTGVPVEICVVAGAKSGASLVARWSAGCIFDEFTKMDGAGDAAVNWTDMYHNIRHRLLPGSQIVSIGNPWAPSGPAYEMYKSHYGKPTSELVIVKTPAWNLNPFWWTEERCAEALAEDPDKYVTECLGEFRSPQESFLSAVELDMATRHSPPILEPNPLLSYRAAMDPATRGNGWTLVIATRVGKKKIVAYAKEWIGSKVEPLSSMEVMQEIAGILKRYRVTTIDSDIYHGDTLRDIAHAFGFHMRIVTWKESDRLAKALSFKQKLGIGEIEIPAQDASGRANLRNDLLLLQKKTTTAGAKIIAPKTSDGRHCDYWSALLLAMSGYLEDVAEVEVKTPTELLAAAAARMKKQREREVRDRQERFARNGFNREIGRNRGPNARFGRHSLQVR